MKNEMLLKIAILLLSILLALTGIKMETQRQDIIKSQAQIELIEQEKEYYEMMVLYLEAKADYYETVYNIDLDDTDDGFILYMIKNHPDVYIYFIERGE